ncbi:hypothetical protein KSC_011430 [Ktedonobacter sp. SOSP1-52]|uniref:DUF58 domain-containing protein n=1 Tax=Ktedonobacter sp. SOSP1-52 TaxID=2778366 RepID=UPI0019154374|nr:DUF58 domain-containing protein [Ktedonobacter sp. SOSP1-52]GHO62251.1 hypothetical protein KSC_011430 [Ktedonobacter sp. SOSP1-52]
MSIQEAYEANFYREILKKRRSWYLVACILFVVSGISRQPLPLQAGVFTLVIAIVPDLYFRYALRHLLVRQYVDRKKLFLGEQVTLTMSIENRKWLPLPWVQMDNTISPPLVILKQAETRLQAVPRETFTSSWLLWSYQRVTQRFTMSAYVRGCHIFGPLKLRCSDPLGWLERELLLPASEEVVVYPLIAPLESLGLPSKFLMGDYIGPRQLLEDPLWFAGIRAYQPGDDLRRIDWKATARTGELCSRIYESTTRRQLLLLLDTRAYSPQLQGPDSAIQEFCISVAASLATWGLEEGYMVGLLANCALATPSHTLSSVANTDQEGDAGTTDMSNAVDYSVPGVSVPFGLNYEQAEDLLTMLACLTPDQHMPMEYVLENGYEMFARGTTILLISATQTLSEDTLELLQEQQERECAVHLVLVGDREERRELPGIEDFSCYYPGGKEKWHEVTHAINDAQGTLVGRSAVHLQLD